MSEVKVIPLKCPNCGGQLEIYPDMDQFACGYCGGALTIQRRGGTIALRSITEAIRQVQASSDKTAAELAIQRLRGELDQLIRNQNEIGSKYIEEIGSYQTKTKQLKADRIRKEGNTALLCIMIVAPVLIVTFLVISSGLINNSNSFLVPAANWTSLIAGVVTAIIMFFLIDSKNKNTIDMQIQDAEADIIETKEEMETTLLALKSQIESIENQLTEKKRIADS